MQNQRLMQEIKKAIQNAFGNDLVSEDYVSYHNDSITILSCKNGLTEGITAHSTLGVCLHHQPSLKPGQAVGVEFVGIEYEDSDVMRGILSTCAYATIDRMPIQPFSCWPDVLSLYLPEIKLQHVLFLPAYLWGDNLMRSSFENIMIFYLLVCPISDGEAKFLCGFNDNSVGAEKLMQEFEKRNVDICDFYRESVF